MNPLEDRVKVNDYVSSLCNPGRVDFGDIIGDHDGSWIPGFAGSVDHSTTLFVELMVIMNGIKLAYTMDSCDM